MAAELTDRASLLRAFFRLTGSLADDEGLTEADPDDTVLEGAYQMLQYGLWDAQLYLIDQAALSSRWVSTHTLTSWSGSDSADGGRHQDLPDDFLRLAGDHHRSALRKPDGRPWGQLIEAKDRFRHRGDGYYLLNDKQLWLCRDASPPSSLVVDYHHRIEDLEDGTTVDFPVLERPLIVAFAADRGKEESWLPGGEDMKANIERNLRKRKLEAARRARRSQQPPTMRPRPVTGTHYIL